MCIADGGRGGGRPASTREVLSTSRARGEIQIVILAKTAMVEVLAVGVMLVEGLEFPRFKIVG